MFIFKKKKTDDDISYLIVVKVVDKLLMYTIKKDISNKYQQSVYTVEESQIIEGKKKLQDGQKELYYDLAEAIIAVKSIINLKYNISIE